MLHIYFGHKDDELVMISDYFDGVFEDSWIDTELSKQIISEIDKSTVLYPRVIDSPFLGPITPRELSGGAKGLILMAYDDDLLNTYFRGSQFGDNTLPLMLKISENREIHVALNHIYKFPKDMHTNIHIENIDTIIKSYDEWFDLMMKYM